MALYNRKDAELAERILKPEYLSQDFLGYMNDYNAVNMAPIPASNIMGMSAAMVPIGVPLMWLRDTIVPQGYVLLDGTEVSRVSFVLLFDLWGTSFNTGSEAAENFRLPDFRGRIPVGKGTNANVDTVGDTEGETTVGNRQPKHKHTVTEFAHTHSVTDPGHTHAASRATAAGGGATDFLPGDTPSGTLTTNSRTTGITIGSSTAASTVGPQTNSPTDGPAFIVVNYITRYLVTPTPQPVAVLAAGAERAAGAADAPAGGEPGGPPPGGPAISRPNTVTDL